MRQLAALLLVVHALALVWFPATQTLSFLLYASLAMALLALVVAAPPAKLAQGSVRIAGFALVVAATAAAIPIALQDIALVGGPDFGALVLRALGIVLPLAMLLRSKSAGVHHE